MKHLIHQILGRERKVQIVLNVRPTRNATKEDVINTVLAVLRSSGAGDETDDFDQVDLVSAEEAYLRRPSLLPGLRKAS